MWSKNDSKNIPELDVEKAYEILMRVFKSCNMEPSGDYHKYFKKRDIYPRKIMRRGGKRKTRWACRKSKGKY